MKMKKQYRVGFYCGGFPDPVLNYWNFIACAGTRRAAEEIAEEIAEEYGERPEIVVEASAALEKIF